MQRLHGGKLLVYRNVSLRDLVDCTWQTMRTCAMLFMIIAAAGNLELALITPPVGMNLFVLKGITGAPLTQIMRGAAPYVGILIVGLFIVWAFPQLALWLPQQSGFGR